MKTNREQARQLLALGTIGQDNCTMAEHNRAVLMQGIGFAILEMADAVRDLRDAMVNDGVVTR